MLNLTKKSYRSPDSRWLNRNSPGLQFPAKTQRVSDDCISKRIFIAHRPGDYEAEEPHGSPASLVWPVWLFWLAQLFSPAWLFWLAQLFCQCPGVVVLHTKYLGPGAVLAGYWSSRKAELPIHLIKKGTETGSQARRFPGKKALRISAGLFQPVQ